ncbi:uncharacterized mitochondrial protein-like protein [Tanacetum coccineum]
MVSTTTMGDENHIRNLGDYFKPSHEGYRNRNELPAGNNVVPLQSDTIRLVQNECSFHKLQSEDPNQHLKDFLKLVDSLDLDGPTPQPQALGTNFEARVRDYMAAHTERMERFKNTIFKKRKEINARMTEMFELLKKLTTSRNPKKVLIREEAKFPVTKNVNSISLERYEEEENNKTDETPDNTKMPTEMEMPIKEAEIKNAAENRAENKSIKTPENKETVEAPGSQPMAYYLKLKINKNLIKGLVNNNRFNNSRSRTRKFRIQQDLQHEHYVLWKVIEFGDSYKTPLEETGKGVVGDGSAKKKERIVAITAEDMQKWQNDVKERTTLLLALPYEHQLQDIVSHLEFMDVPIEQDDLNQKFLSSLAPEWLVYTIVWRNRDDLDTMSLDGVYNHLKAYEPEIDDDDIEEIDIKWNLALLSMRADRFWKKTGKKITIQRSNVAGFDKSKVECFNCHKMGHFTRECISPRSQDRGKKESYKKDPKVEEPAPKAMIAIDGIGWDWSYMAEEDENHALVADEEEVPTEYALMAKSSSSSDNEVYDDSFCSKSCRKNTKNLNNKIIKLNEELSDCETDLYNYKIGLSQVEARLVKSKENEIKLCKRIRVLERDIEIRDNKIENLRNELEEDSDCFRHMTGNISYLSEYEPYNGGYVSFGHGGGKITGKGTIKTDKLDILFTDIECLVLGKDFKLVDDTHVLLRTPRQQNMYSIDLKNIVPHKNLTCLIAKASEDESLPSKSFENNHTCVACLKGKQHKASCKTKCDNGGEFRNKEMDELCSRKGIKREFSNARTPQQNGVAERRNRTLIEAARTISPAIGFLRPFVMILNTLDHLGKFDAKGDEGYLVGYSLNSKAFRVFNKRTKKIDENLHVDFLENQLIEKGTGPNWLFDIDSLTKSMNYVRVVVAGTSSTHISGTKEDALKENVSSLRYIALPNWFHEAQMATSNDSTRNSDVFSEKDDPQKEQDRIINNDDWKLKFPLLVHHVPTDCLSIPFVSSNGPRIISKGGSSYPEALSLGNDMSFENRLEDFFGDTTDSVSSDKVEADLSNMESDI